MKAIAVQPQEGYKINVSFEDGISGSVDLQELTQKGIFKQLQNEQFFLTVYTNGDAIAWSDELEIDALNLYARILNIEPELLLNSLNQYASD